MWIADILRQTSSQHSDDDDDVFLCNEGVRMYEDSGAWHWSVSHLVPGCTERTNNLHYFYFFCDLNVNCVFIFNNGWILFQDAIEHTALRRSVKTLTLNWDHCAETWEQSLSCFFLVMWFQLPFLLINKLLVSCLYVSIFLIVVRSVDDFLWRSVSSHRELTPFQ